MPTASGNMNLTVNGRAYSYPITVTADNNGGAEPTVAAAKTGQLTTRTDADTGTITGQADHGVTTGALIDIYWDGGSRRHVTVGTVAGTAIPIDGGAGDNLPDNLTNVTLMVENVEEHVFDGDDVVGFAVNSPNYAGTIVFRQADGTEIFAAVLDAGESYVWTSETGVTNPLAGVDVGQITFTHASAAAAAPMYAGWVRN